MVKIIRVKSIQILHSDIFFSQIQSLDFKFGNSHLLWRILFSSSCILNLLFCRGAANDIWAWGVGEMGKLWRYPYLIPYSGRSNPCHLLALYVVTFLFPETPHIGNELCSLVRCSVTFVFFRYLNWLVLYNEASHSSDFYLPILGTLQKCIGVFLDWNVVF